MKTVYLLPIMGMFMVMALSNCSGTNIQPSGISIDNTDTGAINQTMNINIYFQTRKDNANLEDCGKIAMVTRTVPMTDMPATAALEQLFLGPTAQEKADGLIDYLITDKMADALKVVFIKNGVAYLDWKDLRQLIPSASSSCGSAGFLKPIEATLKQFPGVNKVIHAIDGQPSVFYEWIQMGCTADNNDCDASPYQTTKLPTVCTDENEGVPVITSISTASGSLGTRVTLRGCNFSGFEGDKTVWIENENGIKGILYGESGSTSKQIVFTLKSPLCQTDTSYSGLPCANTLVLIPGKYQIYTMPWGKISNKAGFSIVPVNEPPFESMSVGAGETGDFSLVLHNNQGALKIQYGTGARVQVHFQSESSKILNVHLETPRDSMGNIRVAQIIFPDGAMDGPFGKDMTFVLTQSGAYEIILSPNMMAGDPWSGEVDLNLKLE